MKKYTVSAKSCENQKKWFLVDADGAVLGRMASQIAARLRGKTNPMYTPHADMGDAVVVINAEKIVLTGRKWDQKMYHRHSGYVGGIKSITARKMMETKPEELVRCAVRGMLPKNRLGRSMLKKLKVYVGTEHPHGPQSPETLDLITFKG